MARNAWHKKKMPFHEQKSQLKAVFIHFSKPVILCFLLLSCKISGQAVADVYL
jgi:hypothetical protein